MKFSFGDKHTNTLNICPSRAASSQLKKLSDGGWWWWANPLQTLSQGLDLTLRFRFDLELDNIV